MRGTTCEDVGLQTLLRRDVKVCCCTGGGPPPPRGGRRTACGVGATCGRPPGSAPAGAASGTLRPPPRPPPPPSLQHRIQPFRCSSTFRYLGTASAVAIPVPTLSERRRRCTAEKCTSSSGLVELSLSEQPGLACDGCEACCCFQCRIIALQFVSPTSILGCHAKGIEPPCAPHVGIIIQHAALARCC